MPKLYLKCNYCGKEWDTIIYSKDALKYQHCPKCNDKSHTYKEEDEKKADGDVFGYHKK